MECWVTRIQNLRESHNLKQKEIAKILEVDPRTYSDYESGRIRLPIECLCKLAIYYNVSADYLLGFTEEKKALPQN